MASLVSQPRYSIKTYWARRNYQRLGRSPSRRLKVARLGAGARSAGSSSAASSSSTTWKGIRLARRAAALLAAPALLLARLRDAYVDAMVALGGSGVAGRLARSRSGAEAALWDKRVPRARRGSGSGSASKRGGGGDFERRMMAHIYSMVVTPELPCAARA
ncbi:hypothetical protein BDA96_09G255800 [Sorghum bicolor]|jgi:hypothetical protein|uniref:Uncharacterized protein n=2 Tax=Sorghum bicolor TaxID=4558 RepID=A0A921QCT0_SORBI|nr:uncharacterized protein LOC8064713 [Sorghum bicolor]EES18730.1 hypothetical protein SORBI_3009G241500 [Sorghum bicolor]KAG0519338.1 hypothetical protein BDA96_09G255800 [Sorghum bicolor]KAG0519339.1 hypothetical protein BDA96_09G255800 [Sorghum bicolor]OQU78474.1 hypothetical protein SORBI_3009G241500 [Sorghum bicolor]OQU78475.1 hypothetical protein SORBI_3009G241500 [Sorghum bicolor]|eukprot:XP_002440300.1 uncharacterized protein LOC8064713 [Sorghum bicolor]